MKHRTLGLCLTLFASLLITSCGTVDTRSTTEQLTNARVAVETAEKLDAKSFAPEQLRHAQDALAIAKDAYANEAYERSFDFAKKATIYALVAKARTEQKRSEKKLTDLKLQLDKVKEQTEMYMNASPQPVVQNPAMTPPATDSPQSTTTTAGEGK